MQYEVLLTKNPHNGYTARPLLMPELVVSGENENDALMRVRNALSHVLSESRIVQVEIETTKVEDDPWIRYSGIWKDMPKEEWQSYLAEIEAYRNEVDSLTQDNLT